MFSRKLLAAAAVAVCGLSMAPADAYDAPSIAPWVDVNPNNSAVGACNFLFSGPSLDPSSTPFHIEGNVTIVSTKVVVSTSIRCRLRLASTQAAIGNVLQQALPGNSSAVVGDINLNSFGPFLICTMVNATFSDTSEYNPTETERCRAMTRL